MHCSGHSTTVPGNVKRFVGPAQVDVSFGPRELAAPKWEPDGDRHPRPGLPSSIRFEDGVLVNTAETGPSADFELD